MSLHDTQHNLRSKRLRLVSEQRKTEERVSRFCTNINHKSRARNETTAKKMKEGAGGGGFLPFFPTSSPLSHLHHFSRGL